MTNVFAELNAGGDKIEVYFRYDPDLVASIHEVPGARFVPKERGGPHWLIPLSLQSARKLTEEMWPNLVLGRALKVWGKEARKREQNLKKLSANDHVEAEQMVLHSKIPELAKWMRPYQRADVMFLAATSALNLNEQRLGKTTEIIGAVFESGNENGAHLVAAPRTALQTVWRYEIERWTKDLEKPHEVITFSGALNHAERERAIEEFWACVDEEWPVWFVCTYNAIRDGQEPFADDFSWNTFIIDEYHRSGLPNASGKKGTGSKFADAVRDVPAERRYALSGTPMGGKPIKLWGGLRFLYPEQYTSKWQWAANWLNDDLQLQRGREDEFYASLAPYVVRRLRSEVIPQLPPAQWMDVWCDMTPKQARQYQTFAAQAETEIEEKQLTALGILAEYTRLKVFADAYCDEMREHQVKCDACDGAGMLNGFECTKCFGVGRITKYKPIPSYESGKLEPLLERLAEQGITGDKEESGDSLAIVASQFSEVADMVHRYLNEKGIKAVKITGGTDDDKRAEYQMLFRQDGQRKPGDPRVIVMTTTAGGVAITLDLVENVHILDETWTPDDQEQLADRAVNTSRMHQIGVFVYRSKNTVEHHIQNTNIDKRTINRQILDLRRQGFRATMKKEVAA